MDKGERLVPLHVRIEASTVAALEALAEREERSYSDVVRRMLRKALEDRAVEEATRGNHGDGCGGAGDPGRPGQVAG